MSRIISLYVPKKVTNQIQKKIKRPYLSKYCEFEVYTSLLFFTKHELPLVRILVKIDPFWYFLRWKTTTYVAICNIWYMIIIIINNNIFLSLDRNDNNTIFFQIDKNIFRIYYSNTLSIEHTYEGEHFSETNPVHKLMWFY